MKKLSSLVILLFALTLLIGCGPLAEPAQTTAPVTQPSGTEVPPEIAAPTELPETTVPVTKEAKLELPWNMWSVMEQEDFAPDYQNRYIMALENVEVKYIPSDDAETIYVLHYELVKLYAAVRGEPENWALVRFASTGDGGGNMGWVKISGLTEYTEETKSMLLYPVTVQKGCKDVETGKELMQYEYGLGEREGEYVRIGNEFGSFKVKLEDILYPDTKKTTDTLWGQWEEE